MISQLGNRHYLATRHAKRVNGKTYHGVRLCVKQQNYGTKKVKGGCIELATASRRRPLLGACFS